MNTAQRTVFITGVSRGLGLATAKLALARGYVVVGTVRKSEERERVEVELNRHAQQTGGSGWARVVLFDAYQALLPRDTQQALAGADILINNSGVGVDLFTPDIHLSTIDETLLGEALEVNAKAPLRLMNIAMPAMKERGWGRVVNVSSVLGKISEVIGETDAPAYRLSKLLLNGITALAAHEYRGTGVLVNSLCPGWCKTEMGREGATDTPEQGAHRILALAEIPDSGPSGQFFIDGHPTAF